MSTTQAPAVQQTELSAAERFTSRVIQLYQKTTASNVEISDKKKLLIQSYYIKADQMLKDAAAKDSFKSADKKSSIPYDWRNVDLDKLAIQVFAHALMELDPRLPNHVNLIPFANGATKKIDLTFIVGYRGLEIRAKKFGLDSEIPDSTTIRLVYSNEKFKPVYRDGDHESDNFFHQPGENPFDDTATIVGGYYYHEFKDIGKNKLVVFSRKDLDKRKPKFASAEFWGDSNKPGWEDEMYWKILVRACYNDITIDASKIDAPEIVQIISEAAHQTEPPIQTAEEVKAEVVSKAPEMLPEAQPAFEMKMEPPAEAELTPKGRGNKNQQAANQAEPNWQNS